MKKYFLLFSLLISSLYLQAQEFSYQVNINTPKLQTTDPRVFETLRETMLQFLNNTRWTDDNFAPEERIRCNIQLTITEELSNNTFSADMAIQAVRPIFGSSSETVIFTHVDKDVTFLYEQFQPLEFSRNTFNDNFASILSFYVYLILGMDYDSFSPFGGEPYFQIANDILNTIPPGVASQFGGWRSLDGNQNNRYWLIENILSPRFRPFREANYEYHRQSLDLMHEDANTGRALMVQALDKVSKVNRAYPNSMMIQVFSNCKGNEVVEIFKEGTRDEKTKVKNIMQKIDAANASKYRAIGR